MNVIYCNTNDFIKILTKKTNGKTEENPEPNTEVALSIIREWADRIQNADDLPFYYTYQMAYRFHQEVGMNGCETNQEKEKMLLMAVKNALRCVEIATRKGDTVRMLIQYRQLVGLYDELGWEAYAKLLNKWVIERTNGEKSNGMKWLNTHASLDEIRWSLKSTGVSAFKRQSELAFVRGLSEQTGTDLIKAAALRIEADIIYHIEANPDKASAEIENLYKKAINLYKELGRMEYLADTYSEIGKALLEYNRPETYEYLKEAIKLYEDLGYDNKRIALEKKLKSNLETTPNKSKEEIQNSSNADDNIHLRGTQISATPCNNS